MGLERREWSEIFKFSYKIFKTTVLYLGKLFIRIQNSFSKSSSEKIVEYGRNETRGVEPKIDFDSLKNQPVTSYSKANNFQETADIQDEIIFEENVYKAPDINFYQNQKSIKKTLLIKMN